MNSFYLFIKNILYFQFKSVQLQQFGNFKHLSFFPVCEKLLRVNSFVLNIILLILTGEKKEKLFYSLVSLMRQ